MLSNADQAYRLFIEPIPGRVTARRGTTVIADSTAARMMHETRLEPVVYFPRSDVAGLSEAGSARRTFCPFKGTAQYFDLTVNGETIPNAAWCYPRTLDESKAVEGYVAFMPGVIDAIEASEGLPPRTDDGHISSPTVDWLLREAWMIGDPVELVRQIAHRFIAEGIAVARLNITVWSLHPQIAGSSYLWYRDTDEVSVSEGRHENLQSPEFIESPIRHVSEGLGGVRQSLTVDNPEFAFPIIEELREKGMTDYVAMPLPFSDGRINVLSMATDHPKGFTTANLGLVFECSSAISRYLEVHAQRATARTLLGTYLGRKTGERVLGGEIKRGDGEEINAAILFSDLRRSSELSDTLDTDTYLAVLNSYFETVADIVVERGGEVLKFIGDGVLAIFSAEDDPARACREAAEAAKAIADRVSEIGYGGKGDRLACTLGACFGRVTYGNVGSTDRLDFTVIGSAANVAARLSDLGKVLDRPILLSAEVAERSRLPAGSLGTHRLHNVENPVEVFAPDSLSA